MADLIKMRMNDGRIIAAEPMEAMGITKAHLGVPYDSDFEEKLRKETASENQGPETASNPPAGEKALAPEASPAKAAMREKIKKGSQRK